MSNYDEDIKSLIQDNLSSFETTEINDSKIKDYNLLVSRGEAALKLNFHSKALAFFHDARKLVPNEASINYIIGDLYNRMEYQNGTSCIEYYRQANKFSIYLTDPYHKLGVALILQDDKNEEAIEIFIECISRYDNEITKDKKNYKLYLYRGIVFYYTKDFEESLKSLNLAAINCDINDEEIFYYMALAYSSIDKDSEAIDSYKKCIEANKKNIFALYKLSLLYHKNNKIEEALKCLDAAIKEDKNFGDALNIKGQILLELNRKDESEKCLEEAKKMNYCRNDKLPNYCNYLLSREYYDKAIELIKTNKFDEAIKYFDESIKLNSNDAVTYYKKGNALSNRNLFIDAIECYKKALDINPDYYEAYNNSGTAFLNIKKVNEALEYFNKAINLNPNYLQAFNNKGNALLSLNKNDEAIECFNKAISINPNIPELFKNKGNAYLNLGKSEEALNCINKAIELNPNNPHYLNIRAITYLKLSKYEEAIVDLKKAISIEDNPSFHGNLGIAYYNLQKDLEALHEYDIVLAVEPDNVLQLNNKALVLIYLNRDDEAINNLEKCLNIDPTYAIANIHLALLYEKKGLYGKTIDLIKKAKEVLEVDEKSSYENKLFIKEQIGRISLLAEKLNVIQVNLDFSEKVLAANGKNTDEVNVLKKKLTIISDDHTNHEKNVQRNSNLNTFDEKKSFEALSIKLEALELDQLKLKEENSVLKSKVQSLEVNFMEVSRIEQNLSNKFSADIEKQGKDIVDKVMLKIIKSGCFNDHDQTIKEIIKDLKDLKMENQYILEVIDKLENMK